MIAEDLRALFDDLKKEISGLKTDLILIKYSIEQIEANINNVKPVENTSTEQEPDPFADRRFTQL